MKALLADPPLFWRSPLRHAAFSRFGTMIFPNAARSLARRPKPRLCRLAEIPLPDLSEITWGETGDARLAGIAMLRALNGGR